MLQVDSSRKFGRIFILKIKQKILVQCTPALHPLSSVFVVFHENTSTYGIVVLCQRNQVVELFFANSHRSGHDDQAKCAENSWASSWRVTHRWTRMMTLLWPKGYLHRLSGKISYFQGKFHLLKNTNNEDFNLNQGLRVKLGLLSLNFCLGSKPQDSGSSVSENKLLLKRQLCTVGRGIMFWIVLSSSRSKCWKNRNLPRCCLETIATIFESCAICIFRLITGLPVWQSQSESE